MPIPRLPASLMPSTADPAARRGTLLRALPYLLSFAAILLLICSGASFWETNDDQHMAMIAHGYGITSAPSAGIVFSGVAWGWLVSRLGMVGGLQGYALGQYALLLLACAVIGRQLYRARVPGTVGAAVLLFMFTTAVLETEFTITAGYLAVAGFALACNSTMSRTPWPWCGAAALLVLAALVRFNEFAFVCVAAAPFVVAALWKQPDRLRLRWFGMLAGAGAVIGASLALDHAYYSGPAWQEFEQRTALAQPFIDYGLADYYILHKHKLEQAGLSVDDMQMLGQRAFMDDKVLGSTALASLSEGVPLRGRLAFNLTRWDDAIRPFEAPAFDLLLAVWVLALTALRRRTAAVAAALTVGTVMLFFWLWGRPGVVRIYLPAAAVLAVLPLLGAAWHKHLAVTLAGYALLAGALWYGIQDYVEHRSESAEAAQHLQAACDLPRDRLLVVWGAAGAYDRDIYRPLAPGGAACPLQLYVVGGLELLPASLEKLHGYTGGKSLIEALLDGQQLYFIGTPALTKRLNILSRYLAEHYDAKLSLQKLGGPDALARYLVHTVPK